MFWLTAQVTKEIKKNFKKYFNLYFVEEVLVRNTLLNKIGKEIQIITSDRSRTPRDIIKNAGLDVIGGAEQNEIFCAIWLTLSRHIEGNTNETWLNRSNVVR